MQQKQKFQDKYRIYKNKCKTLVKIHHFKRDLSTSPIDGLTQNLRTIIGDIR